MSIETGQLIKAEDINFNNNQGIGGQIVKIDNIRLYGDLTYSQDFQDIDFDYCEILLGWPTITITKILKTEITRAYMYYSVLKDNSYSEDYNKVTLTNNSALIATLSILLQDSVLTISKFPTTASVYNISIIYYINKQILKLDKPQLRYSQYHSDENVVYTQNFNNLDFKYLSVYLDYPWTQIYTISKNTNNDGVSSFSYYPVFYTNAPAAFGGSYYHVYKGFSLEPGTSGPSVNSFGISYDKTSKDFTITLNSSGQSAILQGLNIVYYK